MKENNRPYNPPEPPDTPKCEYCREPMDIEWLKACDSHPSYGFRCTMTYECAEKIVGLFPNANTAENKEAIFDLLDTYFARIERRDF